MPFVNITQEDIIKLIIYIICFFLVLFVTTLINWKKVLRITKTWHYSLFLGIISTSFAYLSGSFIISLFLI